MKTNSTVAVGGPAAANTVDNLLTMSFKNQLSEEEKSVMGSNIFPSNSVIQSVKSTLLKAAKPTNPFLTEPNPLEESSAVNPDNVFTLGQKPKYKQNNFDMFSSKSKLLPSLKAFEKMTSGLATAFEPKTSMGNPGILDDHALPNKGSKVKKTLSSGGGADNAWSDADSEKLSLSDKLHMVDKKLAMADKLLAKSTKMVAKVTETAPDKEIHEDTNKAGQSSGFETQEEVTVSESDEEIEETKQPQASKVNKLLAKKLKNQIDTEPFMHKNKVLTVKHKKKKLISGSSSMASHDKSKSWETDSCAHDNDNESTPSEEMNKLFDDEQEQNISIADSIELMKKHHTS